MNSEKQIQVDRVELLGCTIDRHTLASATDAVLAMVDENLERCRYVVTPNVDHVVQLRDNQRLREAYRRASLVLADGAPLVLVSRMLRRHLPERVAGSDLVPSLLTAAGKLSRPLRVFLLGARPGVADQAGAEIERRWSHVEVVGTYAPPLGFEKSKAGNQAAIDAVNRARPDVVVVGLGAPKQELWIGEHADELNAKVALCAGATIDFLAGEKRRSPVWMQRSGLEWLHRLLSEPKRLFRRYARDAVIFPALVWQEWRASS